MNIKDIQDVGYDDTKYGFIYLTTNHINGKMYIGQKKYDKNKEYKTYLGSGKILKSAVKKYGEENFSKIILCNTESREESNEKEKYYIELFDALNDDKFYNLTTGGDGGFTTINYSDEERHIMYSKRNKNINFINRKNKTVLSESQVKEIITRLLNMEYPEDICKDYGVGRATINDIRNHKTWKHLTNKINFKPLKPRYNKPHNKVALIDNENNIVEIFDSTVSAGNHFNISYKLVHKVCIGDRKSTHGLRFKFV